MSRVAGRLIIRIRQAFLLVGWASGLSLLVRAESAPAAAQPLPVSPLTSVEFPFFPYPTVTPEKASDDGCIRKTRRLLTDKDVPNLPSPNPWFPMDVYQGTITRQAFETKLHRLYDPFSGLTPYLEIKDDRVTIYPSPSQHQIPQFVLRFAAPTEVKPPPRWFRTPAEFRAEAHDMDKPLEGLRIAIDPGHIGGGWAQMEERSTRYNGSAPVQEGDLNLITARILKQELTRMGARVFAVRDSTDPVTPYRPDDFLEEAHELLQAHASGSVNIRAIPPENSRLLYGRREHELSQFLFYRCSEILERGNKIRNNFIPDLTVTLYIDATPSSGRGRLTSANANIFFVGGSYTRSEMADPDMRRRCVYKLVEGSSDIEKEVAANIAAVFTQRTGIGPVRYGDSSTTRQVIPDNPYVVARNIAANRNYDGPVVCTEPYFMNNRVVYKRLLAGDYDGQRTFDGKSYGSIFREYADCVAQGILKAYASQPNLARDNSGK